MCSEGKCCCLKLETGTMIFGVIASVLNGLSILGFIGGIIAFNVIISSYPPNESYKYGYGGSSISVQYTNSYRSSVATATIVGGNVGLVFAFLKSVMDFTFSVLLCNGVSKRNPHHIKAYFIYGIVMAVFGFIAIVILAALTGIFAFGLVGVVGLILYGLILHMINLTRSKILNASAGEVYGFEHKRLQEAVVY